MKKLILYVLVLLMLSACGSSEPESTSASGSAVLSELSSNTSWPYEVTGTIYIDDAGVGDSDYANWALGSILVGSEHISIDFETPVLMAAGIDIDFHFSDPATLLLGEPKNEHGMLVYPVVEIK